MTQEIDLRLRYAQQAGDILVTNIVDVINESINEILETQIGSRIFRRSFGSRLKNLLFEPMSTLSAKFILTEIQQALDREEPRVELIYSQSEVKPDYDNNLYTVRITYNIIDTEEQGEFDTFLISQAI